MFPEKKLVVLFSKEIEINGYWGRRAIYPHSSEAILEEIMNGSFPELMKDKGPKNESQGMSPAR